MEKFKSIRDEIFKKMSGEEKLKLALKINDKIFKIAKKKMKFRYPNLDPISFSKKVYKHLSSKKNSTIIYLINFLKKS